MLRIRNTRRWTVLFLVSGFATAIVARTPMERCAAAEPAVRQGDVSEPRLDAVVAATLEELKSDLSATKAISVLMRLSTRLERLPSWRKPAAPIAVVIREHVLSSPDARVRVQGYEVLGSLEDSSLVPLLGSGLEDPKTRVAAADAIRHLGLSYQYQTIDAARRAGVVNQLDHLLDEDNISEAIVVAWGTVARDDEITAPLLWAWRDRRLTSHAYLSVARALADAADPDAVDLMRKILAGQEPPEDDFFPRSSIATVAARYFAKLDQWPLSANVLHKALARHSQPEPPKPAGRFTQNRWSADVRTIATRYLGTIRDERARELLIATASGDPSLEVRTAAVTALSRIGGEKAVTTINNVLDLEDSGQSHKGHENGELHKAAVEALATLYKSGDSSALAALYSRTGDHHPYTNDIKTFWRTAGTKAVRQAAILYQKHPLADEEASQWLLRMLSPHTKALALPEEAQTKAEATLGQFISTRPQKPDPKGGKWEESQLDFYEFGDSIVAIRYMQTNLQNPRRYSHGGAEVYLRNDDDWRLLDEFNTWVE